MLALWHHRREEWRIGGSGRDRAGGDGTVTGTCWSAGRTWRQLCHVIRCHLNYRAVEECDIGDTSVRAVEVSGHSSQGTLDHLNQITSQRDHPVY